MRRIILFFVISVSLLSACQPGLTAIPVSTTTATLALSATPSLTQTPTPPTLTPLPTIPTFTPTFDPRAIVTVTPGPKAECPRENPSVRINLQTIDFTTTPAEKVNDTINERKNLISRLLNKGLKPSLLFAEFKNKQVKYYYEDFTGDGVKDILMNDFGRYHIFYCDHSNYKVFTAEGRVYNMYPPLDIKVADLNKNGLPEIIVADYVLNKLGVAVYMIDEWDGETFTSVTSNPDLSDPAIANPKKSEFIDVNQDGLTDLVLTGGGPWDEDPLERTATVVYSWNGKFYSESYISLAIPQYRYQAIQDGDREVFYGNYQTAIALYQLAIFGDKLEWLSSEREKYIDYTTYYAHYEPTPTVYPTPIPDLTEYPRLAAFAYYRMVILHIHLGEMDAAQIKYATLQEKFPAGNPGHPYVEMASAFWDAYQSIQKMYDACAAAIAYADAHPEILIPLGSDYHGWQSHTYVPADVCPFR